MVAADSRCEAFKSRAEFATSRCVDEYDRWDEVRRAGTWGGADSHGEPMPHGRGSEADSAAAGSRTMNVVPRPGSDFTSMVPPCSRTMLRLTDRPRPVPWGFVV